MAVLMSFIGGSWSVAGGLHWWIMASCWWSSLVDHGHLLVVFIGGLCGSASGLD